MPTEQLELTVTDEKKNQLLGRTELKVQFKHMGSPTPTRQALRKEVGKLSKAPPERVFIRKIVTDYGAGISECFANVYTTIEAGEAIESEYMRKRNAGPEAKKPEAPKEAAPQAEKAPPPVAPETPATTEPQAPQKTESKEKKASKPKAEVEESEAKQKAPKKKSAKEKSDETAEPEPQRKAP